MIIRLNKNASEEERIALPHYEMECLVTLFLYGRELLEMTGSQLALCDHILEKSNMVILSDDDVFLDIDELPFRKSSFSEDRQFLRKLTELAKDPEAPGKNYMHPDTEVVYPALDRLAGLIERCREPEGEEASPEEDNGLLFKLGKGWRACHDVKRDLYTAERSWRGFYQLCEIDKETYDRLGTPAMEEGSEGRCIGEGRALFEADDDYYTMPYCEVHDENYHLLAPWSKAKKRYENTYGTKGAKT
ncbi:MAG: hypothetical protein K6E50_03190 [Lachnospiraceae bacterium]|nr:hypothetical protein [Lachnospiraceae bacterium]